MPDIVGYSSTLPDHDEAVVEMSRNLGEQLAAMGEVVAQATAYPFYPTNELIAAVTDTIQVLVLAAFASGYRTAVNRLAEVDYDHHYPYTLQPKEE